MSRFAPNRIPGRGIPQIRTTTPAVQIHQSSSTERVRHNNMVGEVEEGEVEVEEEGEE